MATPNEIRTKASGLSTEDRQQVLAQFSARFGGLDPKVNLGEIVMDRPDLYDQHVCDILGLETETQKLTKANLDLAYYAKLAFAATVFAAAASFLNAVATVATLANKLVIWKSNGAGRWESFRTNKLCKDSGPLSPFG
jgi:hypothetical protein